MLIAVNGDCHGIGYGKLPGHLAGVIEDMCSVMVFE